MDKTTFMGYKRPYGRVGIRNHVVVMPGVNCAEIAARRIVEKNRAEHLGETPDYQLLTADFFDVSREEAHATIVAGLRSRL